MFKYDLYHKSGHQNRIQVYNLAFVLRGLYTTGLNEVAKAGNTLSLWQSQHGLLLKCIYFAVMMTMKMDSANHTEELPVQDSLETRAFMLIPSRCREKLKTELPVSILCPYHKKLPICASHWSGNTFLRQPIKCHI